MTGALGGDLWTPCACVYMVQVLVCDGSVSVCMCVHMCVGRHVVGMDMGMFVYLHVHMWICMQVCVSTCVSEGAVAFAGRILVSRTLSLIKFCLCLLQLVPLPSVGTVPPC